MMSFWGLFILVILLMDPVENQSTTAKSNSGDYYITWDDLTLSSNDESRLSADNGENQTRIIVVNSKGGGDSLTVQGAVDMVPENNSQRVKIHILPGVYMEKVHVPLSKPYISFIGDQNKSDQTVITWHSKASDRTINGSVVGTWNSATVTVESNYFCASRVTIENSIDCNVSASEGYQAVALRLSSNRSMFYKVRFLGSQDTLLDEYGTHYFLKCFIQGSVDFIFGYATSLYQGCNISVVQNPYAIVAQSRDSGNEDTGYSFVNCTVTGDGPVYLGRAWGNYSRTIFSYTEFDIDVYSEGWSDWGAPYRDRMVVFGEYECSGRGANRTGRVPYSKELSFVEAMPYLSTSFISGELWLRL